MLMQKKAIKHTWIYQRSKTFEIYFEGESEHLVLTVPGTGLLALNSTEFHKAESLFGLLRWAFDYHEYFDTSEFRHETHFIEGFIARYYDETDTFLGVKHDKVYAYGEMFGGMIYLGELDDLSLAV